MIIRSDLLLFTSLLWFPTWAAETRSSESGRPRGVGPEFAKFYKPSPSNTFTCISHPSITIPFTRVNDDYCDCPDGSDEPGTAACAYLSPLSPPQPHLVPRDQNASLALPGFYCKNKGHRPSYIRFESVNDGKCDTELCCDGSDEYGHVGGIKCEDKCKEIGKEWRKNEEARLKSLQGALKRRKELATEAAKLRLEVENKITDVEAKVQALEVKVKDAEEALRETERREKLRVVKVVSGTSGRLGVLLGLAKGRVDELRTGLEKTRKQRDNMLGRVTELEDILAKFKEEYNPNFNDEGVKRAVRGWEEYAARETDDGWEEAEDRDLDAIQKEDSAESGVNWAEFQDSDDADGADDVAALYQFTSYLPPTLRIWLDDKLVALRQLLVENGVLADTSSPSTTSSTESKAVTDARKALADIQRDHSNAQNDLTKTREDLGANYGPADIFRALKNACITKDSGEYTYELCFMGSTKQKPKKGGADTNMGNFAGWDVEDSEGGGRTIVMKYENGQHCWSGPNRSTRVVLQCSEKEEILRVSESEKCVYRMEVGTSAVCEGNGNGSGNGKEKKDEL